MTDFIQVIEHNGLAEIILNRPSALNALNLEMLIKISDHLDKLKTKKTIHAVLLSSACPRSFCAGGDIKSLMSMRDSDDKSFADHIFRTEYTMNHKLARYPKPIICLIDGIIMGGGVGLSIHTPYRIISDRTVFAMPETAIGLFPDVGASWHMARWPNKIGFYLGLTGQKINADDCMFLKFGNFMIPHHAVQDVAIKLRNHSWHRETIQQQLTHLIKPFLIQPAKSQFETLSNIIQPVFSHSKLPEIQNALVNLQHASLYADWTNQTLEIVKSRCPTSLQITLRQFQKASQTSLEQCLRTDFRLSQRFVKQPDLYEGIRATVVDKDNQPQWSTALADDQVESFFSPLKQQPELYLGRSLSSLWRGFRNRSHE